MYWVARDGSSVVQSSPKSDSKGSLIWLLGEAALAIMRTVAWASNPLWDDARSPIVFEKKSEQGKSSEKPFKGEKSADEGLGDGALILKKERSVTRELVGERKVKIGPGEEESGAIKSTEEQTAQEGSGEGESGRRESAEGKSGTGISDKSEENAGTSGNARSYGVGWKLESVTANDVHALIIGPGVENVQAYSKATSPDPTRASTNAQFIAEYLKDTLLVPSGQIVILENSNTSRTKIVDALKDLSHRISVTNDSAIFIYWETQSDVKERTTYLKTWPETKAGQNVSDLSYNKVAEILQQIAREKTDNIVRLVHHSRITLLLNPFIDQTLILDCPYKPTGELIANCEYFVTHISHRGSSYRGPLSHPHN